MPMLCPHPEKTLSFGVTLAGAVGSLGIKGKPPKPSTGAGFRGFHLVHPARLERATFGFGGQHSMCSTP